MTSDLQLKVFKYLLLIALGHKICHGVGPFEGDSTLGQLVNSLLHELGLYQISLSIGAWGISKVFLPQSKKVDSSLTLLPSSHLCAHTTLDPALQILRDY